MTTVDRHEDGTARFEFTSERPLGYEVVAALLRTSGDPQLDHAELTQQLRDFRTAARTMFQSEEPGTLDIRRSIDNRHYLDNLPPRPGAPRYATTTKIIGWLSRASNNDLIDYSIWNVERNDMLQRRLDEELPALQDMVRDRVERLINLGAFPRIARVRFGTALKAIPRLQAIDSFQAGGMRASAYFDYDNTHIAMSNVFNSRYEHHGVNAQLLDDTFHEYMHASGKFGNAGYLRNNLQRYTEEITVTHATVVAAEHGPQPDRFDPVAHTVEDSKGCYVGERELLALSQAHGPRSLTMLDLTTSFFTITPTSVARQRVQQAMDENIRALVPRYHHRGYDGFINDYEAAFGTVQYAPFMRDVVQEAQDCNTEPVAKPLRAATLI